MYVKAQVDINDPVVSSTEYVEFIWWLVTHRDRFTSIEYV